MTEKIALSIGGADVAASGDATFERRNPLTGEVVTVAAAATAEDSIAAVRAAAHAFPEWSATPPVQRRLALLTAADHLTELREEFVASIAAETGAPAHWAEFNVNLATSVLQEAAALTTAVRGETIPTNVAGSFAMTTRVPAGVVLGIAPWNAPVILGVRALATPLAVGNTVVFKGSEKCPRTHRLIVDTLIGSGMPAGTVNFISHAQEDAGAVVEALIAHPAVRRVNFTGSTSVGRIVGRLCGEHLTPSVLELGGKAPFVVLADADVDAAVDAAIFGAFANSGQICMSTERIIVDSGIADDFVGALAGRASGLSVGDPSGDAVLGSVIDAATVARCNALLEDAISKGARVMTGGLATSTLMVPTIVDHVTPDMRVWREETFGPLKAIRRVNDVDEAVAAANDTEFGLSAAVFGRESAQALDVALRIDAGICHVNGPTVHDEPHIPFGGVKSSGWGRFGGLAGVHEFTDLKWITMQSRGMRHYPF
ncbi:aldehyde dehydrogenase [Mycolicibacterium neoaurum]|uniref:aldehyde dehydrogenase n=1 Tax=Mycolicibacterium neoaurum TaxID=1795 RepID=UPI001BCB0800|nr:aldehyde dehydrogenase [Mycolicibacterium neoaurum]QVI27271.1 aldehyde dehydrogenase [Mycolicibacterium neoaurum]